MKDKIKFILYVLIFISSFLPVLSLILWCFKCSVSLFSYNFFAVVSALILIIFTSFIAKSEEIGVNKTLRFFTAFMPVMSLTNAVVYIFKSKSAIVAASMAICFVCSAVIAEKICKSKNVKVISVLSSSVLSVPVLIITVSSVLFGSVGVNTVINTIPSPGGTYYAEIVDSDQGALGGDTVVNIHKSRKLDLLVMTISRTPQRVYIGDWREYETMDIYWKDNQCIIINSKEYPIEK